MAEASSERLAPALDQTATAPTSEQSTLVGRALSRWTRAIREIAASARLPFRTGDDPDLGADHAEKLRAEMRACLEANVKLVTTQLDHELILTEVVVKLLGDKE